MESLRWNTRLIATLLALLTLLQAFVVLSASEKSSSWTNDTIPESDEVANEPRAGLANKHCTNPEYTMTCKAACEFDSCYHETGKHHGNYCMCQKNPVLTKGDAGLQKCTTDMKVAKKQKNNFIEKKNESPRIDNCKRKCELINYMPVYCRRRARLQENGNHLICVCSPPGAKKGKKKEPVGGLPVSGESGPLGGAGGATKPVTDTVGGVVNSEQAGPNLAGQDGGPSASGPGNTNIQTQSSGCNNSTGVLCANAPITVAGNSISALGSSDITG